MEFALYDSTHGYYGSHISGVGRRADFSTSATLSPTLGRTLANWIRTLRPRHVIEIGAGSGALASCIRAHLPLFARRRIHYHIVETSPPLRSAQEALLRKRASWHNSPGDALRSAGGNALILSNELVDAFPVRVFQRDQDSGWNELHLTSREQGLEETFLPAGNLPDSSALSAQWPPGQRIEVHDSYRHWLAGWIPQWKSGEMLTIDYGGSPKEIYHRRPKGTLRAFSHHSRRVGNDVYDSPGRQDLTADVNFEDLVRWGGQLDLKTVALTTQREFLLPFSGTTEADQFLTDPRGAGEAFKVLRQRKS